MASARSERERTSLTVRESAVVSSPRRCCTLIAQFGQKLRFVGSDFLEHVRNGVVVERAQPFVVLGRFVLRQKEQIDELLRQRVVLVEQRPNHIDLRIFLIGHELLEVLQLAQEHLALFGRPIEKTPLAQNDRIFEQPADVREARLHRGDPGKLREILRLYLVELVGDASGAAEIDEEDDADREHEPHHQEAKFPLQ